MSDDCSRKCCSPKQKVYQGQAYIPDDHIQLISKYFQGANLNLNFTLDDDSDQGSEKDCEKGKKRSRSRKRCRKKRRRKMKKCKCCKCGKTERCDTAARNSRCGGPSVQCKPKPARKNGTSSCCPPTACCCAGKPEPKPVKKGCCCRNGKKEVEPLKATCCSCERARPEPQSVCCCSGRRFVTEPEQTEKSGQLARKMSTAKGKSRSMTLPDDNHLHTGCCCQCNKNTNERSDEDHINRWDPSNSGWRKQSTETKEQPTKTATRSSESIKSSISKTSNSRQVYLTKKVSSLENNEVYGRYWYHRPPMENTITHCEDKTVDDLERPYEGHEGKQYTAHQAYKALTTEHQPQLEGRRSIGQCLACKEPMCFICKMNICDCSCEKPNFVICNPCKHMLTPKPPKKPCPPKKAKPKPQPQHANDAGGSCDDAMFLLPLLASMQRNNVQQCCC